MRLSLTILLIMAYLNPFARVTIGEVVFDQINSFHITQSVKEISDKATIILPKNYRQLAGKPAIDYIKAGKEVKIECGYNGVSDVEFTGYVRPGISSDHPLVIECDQLYKLRQRDLVLSYKQVTLKELLKAVAPEYTIEAPDVELGKLVINHSSAVQVFAHLKEQWGLFGRISGNTLYMGWPFDFKSGFTKSHEYIVGTNVKNKKNLKWRFANDFNAKVQVSVVGSDGRKKTYTEYSEGADESTNARLIQQLDARNISADTAKLRAKSILQQNIYNGFEGYITGFCNPRVKAGDTLKISNASANETDGSYLVERVELIYDERGISRNCYISYKTS